MRQNRTPVMIASAMVVLMLSAAGSANASETAGDLKQSGSAARIHCDNLDQYMRLTLDPSIQEVVLVRLGQDGRPEMGLPEEFRVIQTHELGVKPLNCADCYEVQFKLHKDDPYLLFKGEITQSQAGKLKLNLYDLSEPNEPELTWDNVPCAVE